MNARIGSAALVLTVLSSLFWVTSWPYFSWDSERPEFALFDQDFPNCVSARIDTAFVAVGHLSHHRNNSLFVTLNDLDPSFAVWRERADGHFCGFRIPPYLVVDEPEGFGVHITSHTIGWDCPYLLMGALWMAVFYRFKAGFRFQIRDLLSVILSVAVAITCIHLELALLFTLFLNVCTLLLVSYLVARSLGMLLFGGVVQTQAELVSPLYSPPQP